MSKPNAALQCEVSRLDYDFDSGTGRLWMANRNCCDMTACVALFAGIDPDVTVIYTWSGRVRDTTYAKRDGEWFAHPTEVRRG